MLTVIERAASYDLATLAAAKAEMEIAGTADDAVLARFIRQASAEVSRFCDRVFVLETVTETFNRDRFTAASGRVGGCSIYLSRTPVVSIVSVSENGATLADGSYAIDTGTGRLERSSGGTYAGQWPGFVSVTYRGGYAPEDIPPDLERATLDIVKRLYYGRSRDPALRQEQVLDVIGNSYTSAGSEATRGGLPVDIAERLIDFQRVAL